jgi:hypothetical protein
MTQVYIVPIYQHNPTYLGYIQSETRLYSISVVAYQAIEHHKTLQMSWAARAALAKAAPDC